MAAWLFSLVLAAGEQADTPSLDARVTLRPGTRYASRLSFRSEVIDYSGRGLIVKTAGGEQRRYEADEILEVIPQRSKAHAEADTLLAKRKWREASNRYREALNEERHPQRRWVRRLIMAQLSRAYRGAGEWVLAGETFLLLFHDEPATVHFAAIPLRWWAGDIGELARRRAQEWLARDKDPVARLLGASFLLHSQQHAEALQQLRGELSRELDPRIRALAESQAWRVEFAAAGADQIDQWRQQVERMAADLRGGPYYVLGQAFSQRGDPQRAALALLWLPLVYDDDAELAARAEVAAAREIERLGQHGESRALLAEVLERFEGTEAAAAAKGMLEKRGDK